MIFLGAGASNSLGIPTMQEFSNEIFNELKKLGYRDILQDIESSLNDFDIMMDFESLYSILEGLVDPLSSIKKARARASNLFLWKIA